jgi:hypothetical protein
MLLQPRNEDFKTIYFQPLAVPDPSRILSIESMRSARPITYLTWDGRMPNSGRPGMFVNQLPMTAQTGQCRLNKQYCPVCTEANILKFLAFLREIFLRWVYSFFSLASSV